MNKLDRKYITLNAVNGNNDAYCSVSFDFTGAKEKVSVSVNGESCETQSFYVVVKEGSNFLAFYLGDLNKKAENKFDFKKEGCKLGSTIYTLKDVVVVQIVDNVCKQVLYDGIVDDNVGYKGTYTVVVDKPVIVRLDVDNLENERAVVDVNEVGDKLDEIDVTEEESTRGEDLEVAEEESTRGEENLEVVEEESTRGEESLEVVEEKSTRGEENLEVVEEKNAKKENNLDYNAMGVTTEDLINEPNVINYDRSLEDRIGSICNSKTNFEDLVDVEQCEMDCSSQDEVYAKCDSCEYKLFYNEYECQVNEINDDFQMFNELYSRYLRNEFNKNYNTINTNENVDDNNYRYINELEDNRVNGNIEFKNYQNFVEFERLRPDTQARNSDTTVINSTFKTSEDKDNKEETGKSTDFYQQLVGENKNEKSYRKNNKNTSFVDIFNYVKNEFDSIKEIMSLSDEEFAKRSEQELKKEKNTKQNPVHINRTRNLGKITSLRSLIEERVEFKPFEMENHCVKWVQIKLNEVVGFFDNYWKLFWEPFVVDAYKEYKHLLLGFEEVNGEEIYFFAVPAVYNKENIDSAHELGFEYFEVVGDNFGEITDGASGYFIKELKQDEDLDDENSNGKNAKQKNSIENYTYGTKTNQDVIEKNSEVNSDITNANNDVVNENTVEKTTTITSDENNTNVNYDDLDNVETEDMKSKKNTQQTS